MKHDDLGMAKKFVDHETCHTSGNFAASNYENENLPQAQSKQNFLLLA